MAEKIINRNISDELKTSYLNYAMSVIVSRALPDVRDGLKPVHRRILYVMGTSGLSYGKPYKKSATVVGNVIASYHPHGNDAIYESLVRMAQDFSLRYPLVDGQGNFGSIDGDKAAAFRYTEARMTKIADEILQNLSKDTVDFTSNFDDSTKEPTVLPSAIPNLIINGSSGIAVGMATNMPPHNLKEAVDTVICLIDHPETDSLELMQHIRGPDFPTGGIIHDLSGLKDAYQTGRGSFKIRSQVTTEMIRKDREAIIVSEIPYQVNKSDMILKMAELVKNELIKGISTIRDESDRNGIRVVIEIKRGFNVQTILNLLFKHTPLEISYGINSVAIVDGTPKMLGLKEMVQCFIDHRFKVTTRRIQYDLKRARERQHLVEGFIKIAIPNIKRIVEVIQSSRQADEARLNLIEEFRFSEKQVDAVLEMKLVRLVGLEIKKLEEEYTHLAKQITEWVRLLSDPKHINQLIKDELLRIKATYGDERRTEISLEGFNDLQDEDLIPREDLVVSVTASGYIKRIPLDSFRIQARGGMGVRALSGDQKKDEVSLLFAANTHDHVMFLSDRGKAYYLRAFEIPSASKIARGSHIRSLINFEVGEMIQGYLTFAGIQDDKSFVIATRNGFVKRCRIKDFKNAKKRGIQGINLKDQDRVVGLAEIKSEEDQVMIFSKSGFAVKTEVNNIRIMGRAATGVWGMRVSKQDEVIGVLRVASDRSILVVTQNGLGKRFHSSEFSAKGRGGKGQFYIKTDEKSGPARSVLSVGEQSDVFIITSSSNLIRLNVSNISLLKKMARGYKLVQLKNQSDQVISATTLDKLSLPNES